MFYGKEGCMPECRDSKQENSIVQHIKIIADIFSETHLRQQFTTSIVEKIKDWTDCQCVGIRILNADGLMPYEAYLGFSQEFWEHENWLSVRSHQCVCLRIVTGLQDPFDQPVLTEGGSLWTNDLQDFGNSIPQELCDRYRGKCFESGFATLAVLAIRHKEKILGLIHLADTRKDMLPKEKVLLLESVAPLIGEVIVRFDSEDALLQEEYFSAKLIEAMADGFSLLDATGVHFLVNSALCKMTGFNREELIGVGPPHPYWPEDDSESIGEKFAEMRQGELGPLKMRFRRKNGELFPVLVSPARLLSLAGEVQFYFATIKDISGLELARRELDGKVTQLSAALAKIKQLEGILPICMYCKKIRDDDQIWHQLEQYISDHSEAWFSHGICPDCAELAHWAMQQKKED